MDRAAFVSVLLGVGELHLVVVAPTVDLATISDGHAVSETSDDLDNFLQLIGLLV